MQFQYNDGGRSEAGYKGEVGDCVCRAISIATEKPYEEVYAELNVKAKEELTKSLGKKKSSARNGVRKNLYKKYLYELGWKWIPTMEIGSGCKVHLRREELPFGRLIVKVSKHLVAVIDGVVCDTSDPSRNGMRCVYGYWI